MRPALTRLSPLFGPTLKPFVVRTPPIFLSERRAGKVRQTVIQSFGRLDQLRESGQLDRLVESLARYSEVLEVVNMQQDLFSGDCTVLGAFLVFRRLWERLGLHRLLEKYAKQTKVEFDFESAVFGMCMAQLVRPRGKYGVHPWLKKQDGGRFHGVALQHLYRALDKLADGKAELETRLYDRTRGLFSLSVDLVLYDTTTFSFWGEGEHSERLLRRGHSKKKRPDLLQVVVGLLMTREGIPIGHEVFPGNTYDGKTVPQILDGLKQRFQIDKVIFVGDRGMVSAANLAELDAHGYTYIVGMKLRRNKEVRDKVLSRAGRYKKIDDEVSAKEVWVKDRRYVVCHNEREAKRDEDRRLQILDKLQAKIQEAGVKGLVGNRGYRKYACIEGESATIDWDKADREKRYDGKYVLRSNEMLPTDDLVRAYKSLWRVEHAFSDLKSVLDLEPLRHFTDKRIRGHIFMCFLAFLLECGLRHRLWEHGVKESVYEVIDALAEVRSTALQVNGKWYRVRSAIEGPAFRAFKAVGIRIPRVVERMD